MQHPLLCPYCGTENNPTYDLVVGDCLQCEACEKHCLVAVTTILLPNTTEPTDDPLGLHISIGELDA